MSGSLRVARRCLVAGRVQGVFYRATAQRRARELGITGSARNLPDGRVEVLAGGDAGAVAAFCAWLWVGSVPSRVTAVEIEVLDPAHLPRWPDDFTTE